MREDPSARRSASLIPDPPVELLAIDTARRTGGGQVAIERVLRRLDSGAFRVTLACPSGSGLAARLAGTRIGILPLVPPSRSTRLGAYDVLASGVSRKALLPLAAAAAVARLAAWARGRERLVIQGNTFQGAVLAALATRITGHPFVFHDRILGNHGAVERWVCRSTSGVLAVSASVANKWRAEFAEKTVLLVDGIDTELIRPRGDRSIRERLGIAPDALAVLAVSRISHEKGLDVLIEAAARLGGEVVVLVAGEPFLPEDRTCQKELEALAGRRGVSVRFVGFVEDVVPILEAADIFVLSSRVESFGQVILEAMAMEKPVVVPRAGGPLEIVEEGKTGTFFEPDDAAHLAARLDALRKDPALRLALGQAARRVVEERYPIDATVTRFAAVIRALALTRRLPGGSSSRP